MNLYTLVVVTCLLVPSSHAKHILSNDDARCRYTTSSGVIDLNPLASDDNTPRFKDIPDRQSGYGYSWNPCSAFNEGQCEGVEMCQVYFQDPSSDYVLGRPGESSFSEQNNKLYFTYTSESSIGTLRRTNIELVCNGTVTGNLVFIEENPPTVYYLTLTSRYACPNSVITTAQTPTGATSSPSPRPNIFNLKTITILLACILISLCLLNCMVCLGLITRREKKSNCYSGNSGAHTNAAFEKKPLH